MRKQAIYFDAHHPGCRVFDSLLAHVTREVAASPSCLPLSLNFPTPLPVELPFNSRCTSPTIRSSSVNRPRRTLRPVGSYCQLLFCHRHLFNGHSTWRGTTSRSRACVSKIYDSTACFSHSSYDYHSQLRQGDGTVLRSMNTRCMIW